LRRSRGPSGPPSDPFAASPRGSACACKLTPSNCRTTASWTSLLISGSLNLPRGHPRQCNSSVALRQRGTSLATSSTVQSARKAGSSGFPFASDDRASPPHIGYRLDDAKPICAWTPSLREASAASAIWARTSRPSSILLLSTMHTMPMRNPISNSSPSCGSCV
jgi:hypothetical protein